MASGAGAQTGVASAPAPVATAEPAPQPPSPRQLELAHRYLRQLHLDKMMDTNVNSILVNLKAAAHKGSELAPEQQRVMDEVTDRVVMGMATKAVARSEAVVAETFSENELQDLVAFNETSTGQAYIAKYPGMAARMSKMMHDLIPEMQRDIRSEFCARVSCATPAAPTVAKP